MGYIWLALFYYYRFQKKISTGFFWYIIISGIVFFIVFRFFMARQIKKKLSILAVLNKSFAQTVP